MTVFAYLNIHSWYSAGSGVASVSEIVRRARDLEVRNLALTDFCSLAGIPEFLGLCRENGIKGIPGLELPVALPSCEEMLLDRLVLLAENLQGYSNLTRLLSLVLGSGSRYAPARGGNLPAVATLQQLEKHSDGIIAIVGASGSLLDKFFSTEQKQLAASYLSVLSEIFPASNLVVGCSHVSRLRNARELARSQGCGVIALPPVRYLLPEDRLAYHFLAGQPCPGSFSPSASLGSPNDVLMHLAPPAQLRSVFGKNEDILHEALRVADRCRVIDRIPPPPFPTLDPPHGYPPESYLWDILSREVEERYPERAAAARERLAREFEFVRRDNLAEKLILLHALIRYCRQRGCVMGVGSGPAVTSLVAYLLGISQVDPLQFQLNFCGFSDQVSADAAEAFSLEVSADAGNVIRDFFDLTFGSWRVAHVGHYSSPSRQALARELSAWMGVSGSAAHSAEQTERDASQPFERFVQAPLGVVNLPDPRVLNFLLSRLLERPTELTAVAEEFAVTRESLDAFLPLVTVAGLPVTQYDGEALARIRIPRLRLTSSQQLRVLDSAVRWIREEEQDFDIARVPLDDLRTYELLRQGLTLGIEPFQSVSMRSRLRRAAPTNFNLLLKARADEATQRGEDHDLRHFIPECLLAYRLAYTKAHFPPCFYAAALSRCALSRPRRPLAALVRESDRMGVRIIPPDITRSGWLCSVEGDAIRLGMCVVKGLGEKTYREIDNARSKVEFQSFHDLYRLTDRRVVNVAVLENLIKSGALDSFEHNRNELLALLDLIRSSDARQLGECFSSDFDIQPPKLPPPSPRELVEMEIAAMDVAISVDPLRVYASVIKRTGARPPGDLSRRCVGHEVTLVGYINAIDDITTGAGTPTEHVVVDFGGFPLVLPSKVRLAYESIISLQRPLLVYGTPHLTSEGELVTRAVALFSLAEVDELSSAVKSIELCLEEENAHTLWLLMRLFRKFGRGRTRLHLATRPLAGWARFLSYLLQRRRCYFCPPLFYELKKILTQNQISIEFVDNDAREWAMRLLMPFTHRSGASSQAMPAVSPTNSMTSV